MGSKTLGEHLMPLTAHVTKLLPSKLEAQEGDVVTLGTEAIVLHLG